MLNSIKSPLKFINTEKSDRIVQLLKPLESFATSFGLQPFKVYINREKNGISQDKGAYSEKWHLLFAVRDMITEDDINTFIYEIRSAKKYSSNSLTNYRKAFEHSINARDLSGKTWAQRQAYNGLDILLASILQINVLAKVGNIVQTSLYDKTGDAEEESYKPVFSVTIYL